MQITQNVEPPYDLTSHKRPPPVSDNLDLTCVVDYGSFDFIYYLVSSTAWLNPNRFHFNLFFLLSTSVHPRIYSHNKGRKWCKN